MKPITLTIRIDSALGKKLLFPFLYSAVLAYFILRLEALCMTSSDTTKVIGIGVNRLPFVLSLEIFLILGGVYLINRATKGVSPIFSRVAPILLGAALSKHTSNIAITDVGEYETMLMVFFRATHPLWLGLFISVFLLLFYTASKHSGKTPRCGASVRT